MTPSRIRAVVAVVAVVGVAVLAGCTGPLGGAEGTPAPAPGSEENGEKQRYPGNGQYVLEVNRGWMADHGVTEGDRIEFELPE